MLATSTTDKPSFGGPDPVHHHLVLGLGQVHGNIDIGKMCSLFMDSDGLAGQIEQLVQLLPLILTSISASPTLRMPLTGICMTMGLAAGDGDLGQGLFQALDVFLGAHFSGMAGHQLDIHLRPRSAIS